MEGNMWRYNPFFRLGLRRLSRHQTGQLASSWRFRINPLNWSKRTVRVFTAAFLLIMLPIYLYIGLQPSVPAEALDYPVLSIPSISLNTPVAPLELQDHQLIAPELIAGAYSSHANKTLIIGHSSTVFAELNQTAIGESFEYNSESYIISDYQVLAKSEVNMAEILAETKEETIIIMTCAGESLPNQDATHRLLVTAILAN